MIYVFEHTPPAAMLDQPSSTVDPAPPSVWVLGFAGHRNLVNPALIGSSIRQALLEFVDRVDGRIIGKASAASGSDLLFLEACRDADLDYAVVLPFPEDRFRQDFDSPAIWARAKDLIDGAASVEIVPGLAVAPSAYQLAARVVLNTVDAMLFVWDGQPARGVGGTGESVLEAQARALPLWIIDAQDGRLWPFENTPTKAVGHGNHFEINLKEPLR